MPHPSQVTTDRPLQTHLGPEPAANVHDSDWYAVRHDQLVGNGASQTQWLEQISRLMIELLAQKEKK